MYIKHGLLRGGLARYITLDEAYIYIYIHISYRAVSSVSNMRVLFVFVWLVFSFVFWFVSGLFLVCFCGDGVAFCVYWQLAME